MAFNTRFQQMSISGPKQSQHQAPLRQAHTRPVMIVPGSGGQGGERTYINVTPVAVASRRQGGEVQLLSTQGGKAPIARTPEIMASETTSKPNIPAIPRSQAVKQFIEPSYSTLLQLQNDMSPGKQQKKQHQQQLQILRESPSRQSNAIYANIGGNDYVYAEGLRSSDSQSSATEDELLGLVAGSPSVRGQEGRPNYYASPPSPVSSSYSELRQATRGANGAHPLGGYLYQTQQRSASASQAMAPSYDSMYEPVQARNTQPPQLLSRQALIRHQQNEEGLNGDYFGNCSKCLGKIVGEMSGCRAMNKLYHIHCFRCFTCQSLLQGKPFYALDGKPYCEIDYLNTLEKCCKCQQPILDRILRATGKPYHPQCFSCVECKKSLDGVPFTVDASNQIHCIDDFQIKFAPKCSVCNKPIMPEPGLEETVRVVVLDRSFHVKCYKCEDCGLLLSSGGEGHGCYPLDDHVLCKECNTKRIQLLTQKI